MQPMSGLLRVQPLVHANPTDAAVLRTVGNSPCLTRPLYPLAFSPTRAKSRAVSGVVRRHSISATMMRNGACPSEMTRVCSKRSQEMRRELGTLAAYFWQYEPDPSQRPGEVTHQTLSGMTTSAQSISLSKDLRKRGWSFVGPTTMYAFMQAMGLVNDHIVGCAARGRASAARAEFKPPKVTSAR